MPQVRLFSVAGAPIGASELRSYATVLWVGKSVVIGYVLVSLSNKGGLAGVRPCSLLVLHSLCGSETALCCAVIGQLMPSHTETFTTSAACTQRT